MRHIIFHTIFLIIFVLNTAVFAQQPEPLENLSGNEIIAPVLIKGSAKDEAYAGVITTEPTAQRPDALTILRQELNRQAVHEQQGAQKSGVFMSVNKRFTPESITFFIAIGGVTFNSMWIKSHGDPLAMERHILSLKDPIAHLSFYAFMQSQGFYMDWHTKKPGFSTMDPATRKQMMTRLSYQGMAIGSLAASIVADLGQSVKMCTDKWISGKTDEITLESCNQAWIQWTIRSKFTQYFPQIISLWATQAATGIIEGNVMKAFNKVTMTNFVKKILNKDFLVKTAYKITGADVVLTLTPGGGLAIKTIKWAGKLTKFSLFVTVDHFLTNYTYRPINNFIRPLFFNFDAAAINRLWNDYDLHGWDNEKILQYELNNSKTNVLTETPFEKEIENYGAQMQQWREHLNADAEADLAGWMEMTKKILNQIDYAYKYYLGFTSFLYESLSINYQIENKQLKPSAADIISQYPTRTLPFYGVSTGPYKPVGGQVEDYYLLNPNELEKRQKEHILNTTTKYQVDTKVLVQSLNRSELKEFNSIIEKLLSKDNITMSSGLNDLNKININAQTYDVNTGRWERTSIYTNKFLDIATRLQKELGNAQPVVYPFAGYSQAFAAYGANQIIAEVADFSKWSMLNKFNFNKEADLMMYKIICGQPQGRLYKVELAGVNILSPQFDPPSLLKQNSNREEFCNSMRTTNDLYSTDIADKKLNAYLIENINYEAIGDFRNKNKASVFENWWLKNARAPINEEFKNFDVQYKKLFELAYNNYFDNRTWFKLIADSINQSKYLPKSLDASIKAETRFYLQLLSRATTESNTLLAPKAKPRTSNVAMTNAIINREQPAIFNYLEFTTLSSQLPDYISLYQKNLPEVEKLNTLLNDYAKLIQQTDIKFDSYIAHSKKIDTVINDILVLAGFKKMTAVNAEAGEDLSTAATASAIGTENTDKVYEDILVENPTYKQRVVVAAVKGLRQVESEIRRFIRMKVMLSQSLELDTKEFIKDWNQSDKGNSNSPKAKKISPFGPK